MAEGDAAAAPPASGAPTADPLWEDWDVPPRVPDMPTLRVEGFEGPLDLLLDLAERQRIDLRGISIVLLAEQFVAALELLARHVPLERRADWVVLASQLVLLRSRLLLPATPEALAAAECQAAHEIGRLQDLRFVKAAAAWLEARPQLGRDMAARPLGRDPRTASYMALMEACLVLLQGREGRPAELAAPHQIVPLTPFPVAQAIVRLRERLATMREPAPLTAFLPRLPAEAPVAYPVLARFAVCSTFAAMLELTRSGEAIAAQDEAFATVSVTSAVSSAPPLAQAAGV